MADQDHPEEMRVLVHESVAEDLQQRVTRRQALMAGAGGALAMYLAACGGGTSSSGGSKKATSTPVASDAKVEQGNLLIANWVDYSDPANYKAFKKQFGPKVQVTSYGSNDELLAKLRAGGSKFDVVAPTGYAVKTMVDQGLAMKLNKQLIPNLKNLEPAFTKVEYDPGNNYSIPKDYGITSFYWLDDKMPADKPKTIKECFDFLKSPAAKPLRVNFLEGGTQVVAIALKALGYSLNSEKDDELNRAKELLIAVKPNVDTINSTFIERATAGQIDFGMGWNGDIRRAIVPLAKKGVKMTFLVPEDSTEYWVDNWVIPAQAEHPVAAHKWLNLMLDPAAAGKEMNYHQYPVPVKGISGVDAALAKDPVINITNAQIDRYETQLQTAKGQQQRDRIYTEFKAA